MRAISPSLGDELRKMPVSTPIVIASRACAAGCAKSDVSASGGRSAALSEVQAHSRVMSTLLQMRADLAKTWERSLCVARASTAALAGVDRAGRDQRHSRAAGPGTANP